MPSDCVTASYSDYLNTLGELEGFIFSHSCDVNIVLVTPMLILTVVVTLLHYILTSWPIWAWWLLIFVFTLVLVTLMKVIGLAQSWIDHVICSQASFALISGIQAVHLGSILTDHFLLFFLLNVQPKTPPTSAGRTLGTCHHARINWDKVNSSNIKNYCEMLSHSLLPLPALVSNCVSSCCLNLLGDLDTWAQNLTSSLLDCAFKCFPIPSQSSTRKLVGWKEYAAALRIVPISGTKSGLRRGTLCLSD